MHINGSYKTDQDCSATNSLCDLILSLFPIVILWDLQMPAKRKIQLYAVLSTSYLYELPPRHAKRAQMARD